MYVPLPQQQRHIQKYLASGKIFWSENFASHLGVLFYIHPVCKDLKSDIFLRYERKSCTNKSKYMGFKCYCLILYFHFCITTSILCSYPFWSPSEGNNSIHANPRVTHLLFCNPVTSKLKRFVWIITLLRMSVTYLSRRFCFECCAWVRCWLLYTHTLTCTVVIWCMFPCTSRGVNDDIQLPQPGLWVLGVKRLLETREWRCCSLRRVDWWPGGCNISRRLLIYAPRCSDRRPWPSAQTPASEVHFFLPTARNLQMRANGTQWLPLHEYLICNAAISHFCFGIVSSFLLSSPLCVRVVRVC